MSERKKIFLVVATFLFFYFFPFEALTFLKGPLAEGFLLLKWYVREHVLLCLVPAFFIAGAIANFVNQESVMKYFGAYANKFLAYSVASVSGAILAVCSCTVLPIFAGIYFRGAGLGPAVAFLYSGPAINVMAIILTARILGFGLGVARAVGAVGFAALAGLAMHFIFIKDEKERAAKISESSDNIPSDAVAGEGWRDVRVRGLWQDTIFIALLVGILVAANWSRSADGESGVWNFIYKFKWALTGVFGVLLFFVVEKWYDKKEVVAWVNSSWGFAKQIFPLLLGGVFVAGFLLGRPESQNAGLIPSSWVKNLVGGNGLGANAFASVAGAFMYFATLTEVPIVQGLLAQGMGKGPALALLLAGPALSLPSMLVIRKVVGTKKMVSYVFIVVVMATISGFIYGEIL